ncbi:unnamed protein product [Phyllotreta striolata]|uniref:SprT-like domain-containing protein n=1 Tax=Phyllotreta striolata TaxID=444603 RepID=A0A9N9TG44_PHYSR|nr:unnamed protein product [Phyllotreta striolata]
MNDSIALQSTMSPKIVGKLKPGQKQFRKVSGASILALRKSIRRSLILDQSLENRKPEKLLTIDSSSTSSLETLPSLQIKATQEDTVVISATESSICSNKSRESKHSSAKAKQHLECDELNQLLTKYKFDDISKWVREVNENNSNSSLYTELSTIQGSDDGKDFKPKSTKPTCAINSTFEKGHDRKFDKMFSQKENRVLANNTPTTEESLCNSSQNLTIEDSFEIMNESLTTRIKNRIKEEKKDTPPSTPVNSSEKWSYIQFSEDSTNSNKENNNGLENVSKTPANDFLPKWREIEISGTDDSGEDNSYTNILDSLYGKSWRLQKELTESVKKIKNTPRITSDRKVQSSRLDSDDLSTNKSPLREISNGNEPKKMGRKLWFGDKDLMPADISRKQNRIPKFDSKPTAQNKHSLKKFDDSVSNNLPIVKKNQTNRTSSDSSSDSLVATKITRANRKPIFSSSDSSGSNKPAPLTDGISTKKNWGRKPPKIDAITRNLTKDSDDSDSSCNLPTVKKKNRSDIKNKNNYRDNSGSDCLESGVKQLNRNTSSDDSSSRERGTKIRPQPSECKGTNDHKVFTKKANFKLPTQTINISDESESSSDEEWNKTINKAKKTRRLTVNNDGFYSFLSSLSAEVPISKCSFSARIYRTAFKHHKDELVKKLFKLFNETVFNKLLPEEFQFEWKDKLRKTAGTCRSIKVTKRSGVIERKSIIHLSTKVLDRAERLRDTLIHELCHAATWLINGVIDGHGDMWKAWARKAMITHPDLPPIRRCHNYIITTKYTYKCTQCGYSIGRHSKSLNTETKRCGYCYGKFELLVNKTNKKGETKAVAATPKKEATGFARFVKENYGAHKTPSRTHGDVMKVLGQKFKELQIDKTSRM